LRFQKKGSGEFRHRMEREYVAKADKINKYKKSRLKIEIKAVAVYIELTKEAKSRVNVESEISV